MKKGRISPTQTVVMPYKQTKGKEAADLYNQTGRKCHRWQEKQLNNILAVNKDGLWTHTRYGYSVPRRNGKNEIVAMRELYGMIKGERILHTAHRTTTSHSASVRLTELLDMLGFWYRCNPSLGIIFTERSIKDEITGDELDFNIQRLGLWVQENLQSAISKAEWDAMRVGSLPEFPNHNMFIGVKFGKDGSLLITRTLTSFPASWRDFPSVWVYMLPSTR